MSEKFPGKITQAAPELMQDLMLAVLLESKAPALIKRTEDLAEKARAAGLTKDAEELLKLKEIFEQNMQSFHEMGNDPRKNSGGSGDPEWVADRDRFLRNFLNVSEVLTAKITTIHDQLPRFTLHPRSE
jgi:hypothetical protein